MAAPRLLILAVLMTSLGIAATACTPGLVNPQIPPPGPEAFQDGYLDGCTSGFTDAYRVGYHYYRKDDARYAADAEYRRGWDQGHHACYEEERAHPKMSGPRHGI